MPAQLGDSLVLSYGNQGARLDGASITLDYSGSAGPRRLSSGARAQWGAVISLDVATDAPFEPAKSGDVRRSAAWGHGAPQDVISAQPWVVAAVRDRAAGARWGCYERELQPENTSRWVVAQVTDQSALVPWGRYERRLQIESVAPWLVSHPGDQRAAVPWGGRMPVADALRSAPNPASAALDRIALVPWNKFARALQPSVGVSFPKDDGLPTPLVTVPLRSVYMTVNSTSLRRVSDGVAVRVYNMNLSIDMASWVWTFSASLPGADLGLVSPVAGQRVELEATVNGTQFRLFVEGIGRDRSFNADAMRISGRGKAALLDAPTARTQNFLNDSAITVQQMMASVLTENGESIGWDVDFKPTDWLLPAGVFAHTGTYISALNTLALSAGAYVQADPFAQTLHILQKYPVAPWDWDTMVDPDFELPSAPVTRESTDYVEKPIYNRIYVSGVQQGVLGQVTRDGTAGDLLAQMITDPLMTHEDAVRQRALPELAAVGRMANISLRLPVLQETGIIVPGKFVQYVDGDARRMGLVRGVSVDVANPQVWQTISLETHE